MEFASGALRPFHGFVAGDDDLRRDPVAGMNGIRLAAQIQEDDAQFSAIAGVNGARGVGNGDGMLERQSAARPHLGFVARRHFDGQAGRNQSWNAGLQGGGFDGAQVHAGVFRRTVGIGGKDGRRIHSLDSDLHSPLS